LHIWNCLFNFFVNLALIGRRSLQEMDRIFLWAHDFFHIIIPKLIIIIHHFSHKGSIRCNKHISLMDDFEKDIQTLVPVLISSFSFQSLSVESNVPVSEIFQKVEKFGHYCVQPVFLHFHLHLHDQILTTGKNPLVHEISHILLFLVFELEIGLNFVSLDVLD
jgi:hypothetical protein